MTYILTPNGRRPLELNEQTDIEEAKADSRINKAMVKKYFDKWYSKNKNSRIHDDEEVMDEIKMMILRDTNIDVDAKENADVLDELIFDMFTDKFE